LILPSLADILLVVVLLVPGFVSFIIFKKLALRQQKTTDLETTVYSLFASLMILAVFGQITNINNIDSIRDNIFIPNNLALIFVLSIIPSALFGYVSRRLFRRGYSEGDCWAKCFEATRKIGSYVLAYTSDEKEYKGELCMAGMAEAKREIVLNHPKIILRDPQFKILDEIEIGEVILFNEKDIRRIVFLNEISP